MVHPREFSQLPAREVQDVLGEVAGGGVTAAGPDQEGEQLLFGERAGPVTLQPLPRTRRGRGLATDRYPSAP